MLELIVLRSEDDIQSHELLYTLTDYFEHLARVQCALPTTKIRSLLFTHQKNSKFKGSITSPDGVLAVERSEEEPHVAVRGENGGGRDVPWAPASRA